jgi:hypothetical protein
MWSALNCWQRKQPLFARSFSRISGVSLGWREVEEELEGRGLGERPREEAAGEEERWGAEEVAFRSMGSSGRLSREYEGGGGREEGKRLLMMTSSKR